MFASDSTFYIYSTLCALQIIVLYCIKFDLMRSDMFQISLSDVLTNEDVMFVFYSSHPTNITKWLIEESRVDFETDIHVPDNGMLHLYFHCVPL